MLRDVYLASSTEEAAEKQDAHPRASFVTSDGTLVGPAVIHTPKATDGRAREIRAELQVLAHDLAGTRSRLQPQRQRMEETSEEIDFLNQQIEAADADITSAAERLGAIERDLAAAGTEEDLFSERLSGVRDAQAAARSRLAELGPAGPESIPELPPLPQPPVQARVMVETLRRDRASLDARLARVRAERDEATAQDPQQLRSDLEEAEAARAAAEQATAVAEERARAAAEERDLAATAERAAAAAEAEINKAWREASTELDRLRETYEDDDRLRGDIERRVRDAERLLREGHGLEPEAALSMVTEDDSVQSLEKASELVQRRLGLLGRVNLLATGEFEAVQERHDFMQRELDDVRKARRDLLELVAQVDREIQESFDGAFRDVAVQFERSGEGALPRRGRTSRAHGPGPPAGGGDRDRGESRPQAREADLPPLGRRTIPGGARVPLRDLHRATLTLLPDGRGGARARRPEPPPVPPAGGGIRSRRAGDDRHAPEAHDGDRLDDVRRLPEQGRNHEDPLSAAGASGGTVRIPARSVCPSWSRCQRASGSASVRAWRSSSPSCSSVSPSGSSSSDSPAHGGKPNDSATNPRWRSRPRRSRRPRPNRESASGRASGPSCPVAGPRHGETLHDLLLKADVGPSAAAGSWNGSVRGGHGRLMRNRCSATRWSRSSARIRGSPCRTKGSA